MCLSEGVGLDGDGNREKEMGQDYKNRRRSDREASVGQSPAGI